MYGAMIKQVVLGLLSSVVLAGQVTASTVPDPTKTIVGSIIETRGLPSANGKYMLFTNGANFYGYNYREGTNTHRINVFFNGTKGPVSTVSRIEQVVNPGNINRQLFPVAITNNYILTWNNTNNMVINYRRGVLSFGQRGIPGLAQIFDKPAVIQNPKYQVSTFYSKGPEDKTTTEDATLGTYTIETYSEAPMVQPKYRVLIDNAQGATVYQSDLQVARTTNVNRTWRVPFKLYRSIYGGLPNGKYTVNVEVRNFANNAFLGGSSATGDIYSETSQLGSSVTGANVGTATVTVSPNVIPSQIAAARGRLETLARAEWNRVNNQFNTVIKAAATATGYAHNYNSSNTVTPYRSSAVITGTSARPSSELLVNNSWTNMSTWLRNNSYTISGRAGTRNITNTDGVISYRYQFGLGSRDNIVTPVN
jgi:hypothetical protein